MFLQEIMSFYVGTSFLLMACHMPLVEIKDFNGFIDNKPFFDQPVKYKQELYEKSVEMSRNNDYTKGHLLDFSYD